MSVDSVDPGTRGVAGMHGRLGSMPIGRWHAESTPADRDNSLVRAERDLVARAHVDVLGQSIHDRLAVLLHEPCRRHD